MKDPLQAGETPYEILGLRLEATDKDIELAFRAKIGKVATPKLQSARATLKSAAERSLLDLLHYDAAVLARLSPNPIGEPSALQGPVRSSTAQAWEQALRRAFPDVGIAHALAVLSYWSAVATEKQDDPTAHWSRAIEYWSMLAASDEFWPSRGNGTELGTRVIERLRHRLHDAGQRARSENREGVAKTYQELELMLQAELKTARDVRAASLQTKGGKIACGVSLLRHLGMLEAVRRQVDAGLQRDPRNAALKALRQSLSPFGAVFMLLEQSRAEEALSSLDSMTSELNASPEGQRVRAQALTRLGEQRASVGQIDEALDNWEEALACELDDQDQATVHRQLVKTVHARAVAIRNEQPEEAIELLERGLGSVTDQKLSLTLAELLTVRAIDGFNSVQTRANEGMNDESRREIVRDCERYVGDLERAASLGSERAASQLTVAQQILSQLRTAGGFERALGRASAAAEKEDWDEAVKRLREAITLAGGAPPDVLRKNLAVSLFNRALGSVNTAVEQRISPERMRPIVESSLRDLREASRLDPGDQNIATNLQQLQQMATMLQLQPGMAAAPEAPKGAAFGNFLRAVFSNWMVVVFLLYLVGSVIQSGCPGR
jgi:tetratricopeptide (TPR) repeat protein